MDKSLHKWTGRLLILLIGLLLALALTAALALFDDEDYRDALVWAAEKYLDITLAIDGKLEIELGPTLALHAQGLRLQTSDGQVTASITSLATQLQLQPLLSKTIWLDSLTIVGAKFEIRHPPNKQDDRRASGLKVLPKIILQEALLRNVAIAYQEADDRVHEVHIDQLLIDDSADQGPTLVDGRGKLNGQHIKLAGRLGSREHLLDAAAPFSLDLKLNSGTLSVNLAGTIADPVEGRGLDLKMTADDPDLTASLALLGEQVPPLGALHVEARIGGDYDSLIFEQMKLSLRRDEQLDVSVEGSIGNIQALNGLNLEVSGSIDDAKVWQWLTAGRFPGVSRGTLRGSVDDQSDASRVSDLDIEVTSKTGVTLGMKGMVSIDPRTTPITEPDFDLAVRLSAPTLSAIRALVDHDLPELGPVHLSTRVSGRPPLIRFDTLTATVGRQAEHRFTFNNGSGQFDLQKEPQLQKARIPMSATTPRPAGLAQLFGIDTPKLGLTKATGTWIVDRSTIKLEQFDSSIQLTGGATHRLAGTMVHRIGRSTTTNIRFDLDTDRVLSLWTENTPGELGRIAGRIDLLQSKESWQIRSLQLDSTETDLFKLNVTGKKGARKTSDPGEMEIRLQIDDPQRLFITAGLHPLPLAPIHAGGTLTAHQGEYRYRGKLVAGKTASQLNLTATYNADRPAVSGEIKTPLLTLADIGLSLEGTQTLKAAKAEEAEEAPKAEAQKETRSRTLFSREPLDLAWLHALDLDLSVHIDELRGADLKIDEARGRIILESGRLRLRKVEFRYFGGMASGYYEIDTRSIPKYIVDASIDDLALGDILAEFLPDTIKGGIMDLELKLEGHGKSAHQVASSLNGALDVAFEKTDIPSAYVELLSADILGWTLGRAAFSDGYSHIDCGVIGLDIESGVAQSHALLADGSNINISGSVRVDLGSETIELVILPEQKKSVFTNATPVRVSGNLLDPRVEAIPAKAATKRIGAIVLLPQVFIPLEILTQGWRLLDRRSGNSPGCTKVLGRSVDEGFAFEGAQPQTAR